MSEWDEALERLEGFYNGNRYDSGVNPGGLDNDGHRTNFVPALRDVATAAAGVADLAQQAALAAAAAANVAAAQATSATELTIGTGVKSLTVQTGRSFATGMPVAVAASATARMIGTVASYDAGTGALDVLVVQAVGVGTFSAWTVSLTGPPGLPWRVAAVDITAAPLTLTSVHNGHLVLATAALTITLPSTAATGAGWAVSIASDEAGGVVTVDADGSDLIAGRESILLPPGHTADLICAGDGVWVVAGGPYQVTQTVVWPAGAFELADTDAPEVVSVAQTNAPVRVALFDAAAEEVAHVRLPVVRSHAGTPPRVDLTAIRPTAASATAYGAVFRVQGAVLRPGQTSDPAFTTGPDFLFALTAPDMIRPSDGEDSIPLATAPQPGDTLVLRVARKVGHAADTCDADVGVYELRIRYEAIQGGDDA
ncbi:MAG: hypothetical protein OHK0024_33440 [Thalassobaculales bacterium]